MADKTWNIELEDGIHKVEVQYGMYSNRRTIYVDGQLVAGDPVQKRGLTGLGGEYPFRIGSHKGIVVVRTDSGGYEYDLIMDGVSQVTGQPYAKVPMPVWGWAFIVACALIPVVGLGGALPFAIGGGGVTGCVFIARSNESGVLRFALCAGLTLVCWMFFALVLLVPMLLGDLA